MKTFVTVLLFLLGLSACSGNEWADPTASWRFNGQEGRYTVLSIRNNGTFDIDIQTEGQLSKIVKKSGQATGTWEIDKTDARLILDITSGADAIGWPEGPNVFHIRQMDKKRMVLVSSSGLETQWEKSSHRAEADPATGEAGPSITLAPLVVSLMPGQTQTGRRYKWLCVAMEVQLAPGSLEPEVRSQWQEKVILLLSSKTYEEVNTLDKLKRVGNELKTLLDPYMNDNIQEVRFTRTIVTGNQEAVDTFCSQFDS